MMLWLMSSSSSHLLPSTLSLLLFFNAYISVHSPPCHISTSTVVLLSLYMLAACSISHHICVHCIFVSSSIIHPLSTYHVQLFLSLDGTLLCCLLVCSTLHGAYWRVLCDQCYRCRSWCFQIGVECQVFASTTIKNMETSEKKKVKQLDSERPTQYVLKSNFENILLPRL